MRTQNSQHHAEDGDSGRDGPRRDGLGTPCDAARLTVLRASQRQECIQQLYPDLQEQSPPASHPASNKAPQRWWVCPPGDGGKRSAQPPVLAADTKSTRRSARGVPSFGEAVGDQISVRTTMTEHPPPDTQVATAATTTLPCGASKNLLGMAFAKNPC